MKNEKIIEGLNDLLTKNYDSGRGYKNAAEKTNNPTLAAFFRQHASKRYSFGHEIKELIKVFGGTPDKGTSFMGDMHNAWITLKTTLSSDKEEALLEAVEEGEEACLEDYNEFLKMEDIPLHIRNVISRQRNQVAYALNKVEKYEEVYA